MANVGGIDRILRFVLGVLLMLVPFLGHQVPQLAGLGAWAWVIGAWGLLMFLSALFRFCPAYTLLGVRTCAR